MQCRKAAAELVDEIRRSLDYYQGQEAATPVQELVLSGKGALVRNLDAEMAEALGLRVVIGDPMQRLSDNSSSLSDDTLAAIAPSLAVAIGLALPEED